MIRRPPQHRRGYALLLVLVALALTATLLTAAARRSVNAEADVRQRAEAQRQVWAARSASAALAAVGPDVLGGGEAVASRTLAFDLGGVRVEARVDDEAAKLPVAELLANTNLVDATRIVAELSDDAVRLGLDPIPVSSGFVPPSSVHGYGQLFADTSPRALMRATRKVTPFRRAGIDRDLAPPDVRLIHETQLDDGGERGGRPGPPEVDPRGRPRSSGGPPVPAGPPPEVLAEIRRTMAAQQTDPDGAAPFPADRAESDPATGAGVLYAGQDEGQGRTLGIWVRASGRPGAADGTWWFTAWIVGEEAVTPIDVMTW